MASYVFRYTISYILPICSEHKEFSVCECGMNMVCYNCGNGHGASPCQCTGKIEYLPVNDLSSNEVTEDHS